MIFHQKLIQNCVKFASKILSETASEFNIVLYRFCLIFGARRLRKILKIHRKNGVILNIRLFSPRESSVQKRS